MTPRQSVLRWALLLPVLFLFACAAQPPLVTPTPFPYDIAISEARRAGRPAQALYWVEAQAANSGWTPELSRVAGDLWDELGDRTRAVTYWEASAQAETPTAATLRALAGAYIELGQWTQAHDALERLIERSPQDGWAHLQLGLIDAPRDPARAVERLRAASLEPAYQSIAAPLLDVLIANADDPLLSLRVGLTLMALEQWAQAELAFERAAVSNAPFPLAMAYGGLARDQQGKDGSPLFDEALAQAPDDAHVRLLYGLHLRVLGDDAGSLNALADAVALDPDNPALYAELSSAYRLLRDLPEAEYWLRMAVAVSENDPRFLELLALFYADEADTLTGDGVTAMEQTAAELGTNPDVLAASGWVLYRAGRTDEAASRIDLALELAPDSPRASYYKGRMLFDAGEADQALAFLRRAAESASPFAADAGALLAQHEN
jgi:tetratricopeptide (TPR) repeat protein